jgi:hypothetical protein
MTNREGGFVKNMVQMKWGGLVLTGVGAYLIVSKVINSIRASVHDIAEAKKWEAYYKCARPEPLAPGYEFHATTTQRDGGDPPGRDHSETSSEALVKAISGAINKAVDGIFSSSKGDEIDGEGLVEVSEDVDDIDSRLNEMENKIRQIRPLNDQAPETFTDTAE